MSQDLIRHTPKKPYYPDPEANYSLTELNQQLFNPEVETLEMGDGKNWQIHNLEITVPLGAALIQGVNCYAAQAIAGIEPGSNLGMLIDLSNMGVNDLLAPTIVLNDIAMQAYQFIEQQKSAKDISYATIVIHKDLNRLQSVVVTATESIDNILQSGPLGGLSRVSTKEEAYSLISGEANARGRES